MTANTVLVKKILHGPAMQALPNSEWQLAAIARVFTIKGHGAQVKAYVAAGLGEGCTPHQLGTLASEMFRDQRMTAAIKELRPIALAELATEGVHALKEIIDDPAHKDRARVALAMIEREHPTVTEQHVQHTHTVITADNALAVAIERYHKLKDTTPHEGLLAIFGPGGLERIEEVHRQKYPDTIDAEFSEVFDIPSGASDG